MDALRGQLGRSAWVRSLIDAAFAQADSPAEWLPPAAPPVVLPADLGPLEDKAEAEDDGPPPPPTASNTARRFVAALVSLAGTKDDGRTKLLQDLRLAIDEHLRG